VPIVLKSGSLNLLEPSVPVHACNGIAVPLYIITKLHAYCSVICCAASNKIHIYFSIHFYIKNIMRAACFDPLCEPNHSLTYKTRNSDKIRLTKCDIYVDIFKYIIETEM